MKKNITRIIISLILAVVIATVFLCGCHNSSVSGSYAWIIDTIEKNYYEDIPRDKLHESVMKGGVNSVLDIYSAYYTKDEYDQVKASNSGSKSGAGVSYQFLPEGVSSRGKGVLIVDVVGGSPAFASGLKPGTFVSGLRCGEETVTITSADDFSAFIQARETGEKFTLVTDRGEYEMSKENYTASYCTMYTAEKTYSFNYDTGSIKMVETEGGYDYLPQGAACIKLDQFYGNAVGEFGSLIAKYKALNCTSLILDLRQNGGGYVDVMQGISGIFTGQLTLSSTVAMTAVYKNGYRENFPITKVSNSEYHFPADGKISVLADNGTASASEALIGVLISCGLITPDDVYISDFSQSYLDFTGTADKNNRTYGKGIMQSTFENSATHEVLKLTTAKIYWPNGTCIHGVGLNEEMGCKTLATDWCTTYGDWQLALAVDLIY